MKSLKVNLELMKRKLMVQGTASILKHVSKHRNRTSVSQRGAPPHLNQIEGISTAIRYFLRIFVSFCPGLCKKKSGNVGAIVTVGITVNSYICGVFACKELFASIINKLFYYSE